MKKLFRKDAASYIEKGEKLLVEERYAEARAVFQEALEKLDSNSPDAVATESIIKAKISTTGNGLALLNIQEAEYSIRGGDKAKAADHLNLAIDLADDVTIREKAEMILVSFAGDVQQKHNNKLYGSCGGCHGKEEQHINKSSLFDGDLAEDDRFELLVRPLPGDLPERYMDLGEKFALGYLAAVAGDVVTARKVYEELLAFEENDIVLYEIAILFYGEGDTARCEAFLHRAIELNGANPLCYLGLVHLLTDAGRFDETVPLLEAMIDHELLAEQARMLLGDTYQNLGDSSKAMDCYSRLLSSPLKREAAERLIHILEKCGRSEEAEYLFKNYLKGCC